MFIIDRFERGWAVVETSEKNTFRLPQSIIPAHLKEGDCIHITVSLDEEGNLQRKNKTKDMLDGFFDN